MSEAMLANEMQTIPLAGSSIQDIPLDNIRESSTNPRRLFDESQLRELAANIQLHGVLQAILVRPSPDGADGMYELVAGARRFRASKLAGKNTIPAAVRNLTDAQAQELRLIENLQRSNIHEMDEGIGYRSLIDLRPDFYTVETIAAQVAKSPSYVKGRISLTELIRAAQTAFYDGRLSVAHALEIARLQPRDQERAFMECFPGHRSTGSILKDRKVEALTVRQLREWIERELHLDLRNAPFDTEDANLLPAAGACSACPKRTGNNPLLFPEIKNRSLCTNPVCHQAKIQAFIQLRVGPLVREGKQPVQISESPSWQVRTKAANTLYEGQYRRAERGGECPHTQVAVLVDCRKAGTVMHICVGEKCKIHRQFSRYEISPQERDQRRKTALAVRIQKESRLRILQVVRQKLPSALARADFEMVALDYFRRLGHDNHHRVFRVYGGREEDQDFVGWEFSRTRKFGAGSHPNHESCRPQPLHGDVRAYRGPLLPRLQFRRGASKEANLMRTAVRYKVDASKIITRVSAELSFKRSGARNKPGRSSSGGEHQTAKAS